MAKDIVGNWSPVPRKQPTAQDEVDASRHVQMFRLFIKKSLWIPYFNGLKKDYFSTFTFTFTLTFTNLHCRKVLLCDIKRSEDIMTVL